MDIISEVVKTEKNQAELLIKTEAELAQKLEAKEVQILKKFEQKKADILAHHDTELAKLEKSFAAKQKRLKEPSYEISDMKPVLKEIMQQLKWQLKE